MVVFQEAIGTYTIAMTVFEKVNETGVQRSCSMIAMTVFEKVNETGMQRSCSMIAMTVFQEDIQTDMTAMTMF